ncbi:hypothetical protein IC762_18880 [Bradyrhizobium genosp. L]|uniref:hypothetical protein n=1 Tax=Bradyrhizobium genosp. L TaxID=83637 RepID=UPI0018A24C26|nr:hypothetical protein [Bradyrhizobium genosp. L]QPF81868.1 hypothetical protein IC762_18880 [Bradyrhizobium genosp. L]
MRKRLWQRLWQTWTVDKPAAVGDWLWQILVVELAALLDRLTLRKIIALIPVVIVIGAYLHRIPLPPELMLVGDVLAYIDIFSMILLVSLLTRMVAVLAMIRQAADHLRWMSQLASHALRRIDGRHRRAGSARRRNQIARAKPDEDEPALIAGLAVA